MLNVPTLGDDDEDDGLLAESDMASSLYGPVSGMLDAGDELDEDDTEEFPETVESLLEDDPFEMTDSPMDAKMSDAALLRELNKQRKPTNSNTATDLGLYEVKELGFDAFVDSQRTAGIKHHFDSPAVGKPKGTTRSAHKDLPFKLKLRDLHIIWNIYDGYDWQRTRDGITEAVEQVEIKVEERKAKRRHMAKGNCQN